MQDEMFIVELYSKVNPFLLSEVVNLILTKPSINKSFTNENSLKTNTNDFTDTYFYLTLQSIPKVHIKCIEPDKNQSKVY